ncbi:unnamed protein product [Prunus brigantina]
MIAKRFISFHLMFLLTSGTMGGWMHRGCSGSKSSFSSYLNGCTTEFPRRIEQ